ncbi:2-hydroxyacyl-CoA dehydratase [Halomonas sp. WWR20]
MAFRQVKDLLGWIVDFHEQLAARYENLADEQQDERMKMTLTFLTDREQRMSRAMASYIEDAHPNLLKTWLIDSQDFGHPNVLARIPKCLGCRDVQEILANALTVHQTLKDMYRLRAELARTREEAELFENLMRNQETEARLQARDIARLEVY